MGQAALGDRFFQQHWPKATWTGYEHDLVFIESLREPLEEALATSR